MPSPGNRPESLFVERVPKRKRPMPQMITALFRDSAQAHRALQALMEMGIAQTKIVAAGFGEGRDVSSISGFRTLSTPDDSQAALAGLNLPAPDPQLFEQGLPKGRARLAR